MANTLTSYQKATGKIDYTFTNNYMFHIVLQSNELVLKGLISSLLHLPMEEIVSVEIKNPIIPGEAIDMKEFILDLYIILNNSTSLDLEMQVENYYNWTDRSLSYLCRSFDQLCKGEDYQLTKPVIHIGILDFTLFPEAPEFYATYKLLNVKNHKVFNDKFILGVLSLKQIKHATEEDKKWQLDTWAKFFAAKTWRDLKMIAENNEILTSATQSLYEYNSDWLVRERCRAREDYEHHQRLVREKQAALEKALTETEALLEEKDSTIKNQNSIIKDQAEEIKFLKAQLAQKNSQ